MINSVFGNHPAGEATVVDVKHTVYAIGWLALNQSVSLDLFEPNILIPPIQKLDPTLLENRQRPKQFWFGKDIGELMLLRTPSDAQMHCGDHVRLKDTTPMPVTVHGQEGVGPGVITVDMYVVLETQTQIDVLWQDGTKETVSAKDVIPHTPDEYDCWSVLLRLSSFNADYHRPGDHVMWKSEDEKRPAIVQSVDAARRTATVLFPSTNTIELVSLLELDPQGTSDSSPLGPDRPPDGLGA
jgi:ubiquitin-conjugating enzyme E2 O